MKPPSFAAALGVATMLTALPALGMAAAPAAQNTVTLRNYAIGATGSNEINTAFQGHLRVSFRNDGDVAATAVAFDLLDDGEYAGRVDDLGTFSKGVTINHEFHWMNVHEGQTLQIAEVRYADGTIWTSDGKAPLQARRQAR